MKKKSQAEEFADTIRENPAEIIAWIDREVAEYKKLRAILVKRMK